MFIRRPHVFDDRHAIPVELRAGDDGNVQVNGQIVQLVGTIVQLCPAIHIQHRRAKTFDVVLQDTDDFTPLVVQFFHDATNIVGTDVHVPIVPELDVDVQLILHQTESTFLQNLHDLIRFEVPDVHGRTKDTKDTKNRFPDIVLL